MTTLNEGLVQREFRVAIMNFSGNTGKTTIARHLLKPRMLDVDEIIYIESANADEETKQGTTVRAAQFEKVAKNLMESMAMIVDIGASNVEETLELMRQIDGSHEDFDYFVVPMVESPKQRADSVNTVKELLKMGVEPEKIKPVFNRVGVTDDVEDKFADVIYALENMGVKPNLRAVITESNFFPKFEDMKTTLEDLFSTDIRDNKKRQNDLRRMGGARTNEETKELRQINELITLQRMAASAISNLDEVYFELFAEDDDDYLDYDSE